MKRLILIFIFIVVLVSLILYYTYAIDVSMDKTTGAVDLVLNVDIKNPSNRTVTVEAGKTKILDMVLSNSNGVNINYGIAYSGTKPSTVKIAQANSSKDPVSGTISNNATKYVTIVIENKSNTNYTYTLLPVSGYQNGGSLIIPSGYTLITDIYNTLPMNANEYIMSLSQGDSWSSGASGVYQTNGHEYRYVGANVNNYVRFNNDLYRIIGVFDSNSTGVSGNLVKLIAANPLGGYAWGAINTATAYTTYSEYNNNWETANANILLNEYFLNASNTSSTYKSCSDWTYYSDNNDYKTKDCNDIIGYGIQTTNLRNYIQPVTWYLKGYDSNSYSKQNFYTCERSDANTIENCTSGNSGAYATKVTNKSIGLMYASDYLYASGYYASTNTATALQLYYGQQNWLYKGYEWTITPDGSRSDRVFNIDNYAGNYGSVNDSLTYNTYALRPTFYLKSTIKIKAGDGTFTSPFLIG